MEQITSSVIEVGRFVMLLAGAIALIEGYLLLHFKYHEKKWFIPASLFSLPLMLIAVVVMFTGSMPVSAKLSSTVMSAFFVQIIITLLFKYVVKGKHRLPYMLLAPGFIGLALLIIYPLVFEIFLSFHDLKLTTIMAWKQTGTLPFVGFHQFSKVFTSSPLSEVTFWQLLGRTLWWTFVNVFFHVFGGFLLALLLNNKMKVRGIYRTLLVIPWAMPQVVAVLAMRGEFHSQYGFVNIMIERMVHLMPFLAGWGVGPVQWLSNHPFMTCTLINIWLGIPFMMVIILGGLQSVSQSYYDAAAIDGASYFQKLWYITIPLLKPVLAPAITLGAVWTFNNINVIYLVTGQSGGTEEADILVTALYKAAFTFYRYSYSAAFAIIIFLILFAFSFLWLRSTKSADSV